MMHYRNTGSRCTDNTVFSFKCPIIVSFSFHNTQTRDKTRFSIARKRYLPRECGHDRSTEHFSKFKDVCSFTVFFCFFHFPFDKFAVLKRQCVVSEYWRGCSDAVTEVWRRVVSNADGVQKQKRDSRRGLVKRHHSVSIRLYCVYCTFNCWRMIRDKHHMTIDGILNKTWNYSPNF